MHWAINFNKLYDKTKHDKWAQYFKQNKLFLLVGHIAIVTANETEMKKHIQFLKKMLKIKLWSITIESAGINVEIYT